MPAYDASTLRRVSEQEQFPHLKDRGVTLLKIDRHGVIRQARTVADKKDLIDEFGSDDCLLAAWTGQWYTNIFLVDLPREQLAL